MTRSTSAPYSRLTVEEDPVDERHMRRLHRLRIPVDELGQQGHHGITLHRVAGKCGVFAEMDINGLQTEGTPSDELMASRFDAIVLQNLAVLTRGRTRDDAGADVT